MTRRISFIIAALLAAGAAPAQTDSSAQLRASRQAGEQVNGYMGVVGTAAPGDLRRRVDAVNIRRRAAYTRLAGTRGVQIEEVAATMACELLATSVLPGQYYRLADGVWRQREGNAPVPRPPYCI